MKNQNERAVEKKAKRRTHKNLVAEFKRLIQDEQTRMKIIEYEKMKNRTRITYPSKFTSTTGHQNLVDEELWNETVENLKKREEKKKLESELIKMMDDYYKKSRFERIKQSKQIKKQMEEE